MPKFQGVDYFAVDTLLSEDELLVRNTVREFVEDRVLPVIERHNRAGTFPMEIVPAMAQLGLFGATLPPEFGCAGMNNACRGSRGGRPGPDRYRDERPGRPGLGSRSRGPRGTDPGGRSVGAAPAPRGVGFARGTRRAVPDGAGW
ncbi:MAG TPA: acyl-CoA dehydrogenase family protein, partial [Bacteroidota bacterium]